MIENTLFRPAYIAAPFAAWAPIAFEEPRCHCGYVRAECKCASFYEVPVPGQLPALTVAENVRRARLLAAHAYRREGIAPVCLHGEIDAGTFGNDGNPEDRERGLLAAAALAYATAEARKLLGIPERRNVP